jgi:hypothetical protein
MKLLDRRSNASIFLLGRFPVRTRSYASKVSDEFLENELFSVVSGFTHGLLKTVMAAAARQNINVIMCESVFMMTVQIFYGMIYMLNATSQKPLCVRNFSQMSAL